MAGCSPARAQLRPSPPTASAPSGRDEERTESHDDSYVVNIELILQLSLLLAKARDIAALGGGVGERDRRGPPPSRL